MARVEVHGDRVVIRLAASEKFAAMHRSDITLERAAIASAVITEDPWVWIRGVRAPGIYVPGKLAVGTWRHSAGRDFVLARSGRGAVVIDFDPAPGEGEDRGWHGEFDRYARVVVSTTHAAELVQALRAPEGPSDPAVAR